MTKRRTVPRRTRHQRAIRHAIGHGVVRGHVVDVVKVLHARLAEPWTLASLAGEVHLSHFRLGRAFDAAAGASRPRRRSPRTWREPDAFAAVTRQKEDR